MVSVIIATYQMADTLERCVRSVMAQTYKDLEIIIIDDGSTDDTIEKVIRLVADDERIVYKCQKNKGHSAARNKGMDESKGEYLFFIDADDYIHPHAIETLLGNLKATESDISIGQAIRSRSLPKGLINELWTFTPEEALKVLTRYTGMMPDQMRLAFTATWNKIFHKKVFEGVRFPEGHQRDDNFTAHRLLSNAKKIVYTPAETYFYTYNRNSMSSDGLYKNRDLMLAFEDRTRFFKENDLAEFLPDTCARYMEICRQTYAAMHEPEIMEKAREYYKENEQYIEMHSMGPHYKKMVEDICR